MAVIWRNHHSLSSFSISRMQTLIFELLKPNHTLAGEGESTSLRKDYSTGSASAGDHFDTSAWKAVNSKTVGIKKTVISSSVWTVLTILKNRGFEAYLVGGCVRDLLLKKTPKDFDVVTTADLKEIKKQFNRCIIVGRRFPICHVYIKNSVIEVSSFETAGKLVKKKEALHFSQMPKSCDHKDFVRFRNCMQRDFTINGLFYDPSVDKVYDYLGGIKDLRTSKLRTVIPACKSFKEDCARILRGLRIAARLGLGIAKETAAAIRDLSSSIITLSKSRLVMEINFMLAYGAAEPSICLLQKFKILDILLPVQAVYLAKQTRSSSLLMKLFSSVDKLLAADRPTECSLWVGLLAFHLALVQHPRDSLVLWTFSSILCHGNWTEAVELAKENEKNRVQFVPEISESSGTKSDESLLKEVSQLASLVQSSLSILTSSSVLIESMARYQMPSPCHGLVFVTQNMGKNAAALFDVFLKAGSDYHAVKREGCKIDYELLKKGDRNEIRFVLGKVIMDAMNSRVIQIQKQEVDAMNSGVIQIQKQEVDATNAGVIQIQKQEVETKCRGRPLSKLFS